jgi:hypothetical protein
MKTEVENLYLTTATLNVEIHLMVHVGAEMRFVLLRCQYLNHIAPTNTTTD